MVIQHYKSKYRQINTLHDIINWITINIINLYNKWRS